MNKLKIIVLSVLSIVMFALCATVAFADSQLYEDAPSASVCELHGDLTEDGEIGAADARFLLRMVVGLVQAFPEQTVEADLDADGYVTAADARLLLRFAVKLENGFAHGKQEKVTLVSATCYQDGKTADLCKYCAKLYNHGTIPNPGHKNNGWTVVTPATCTKTGVQEKRCVFCDLLMDGPTSIPLADHTWGPKQYENDLGPSCTHWRNYTRTCTVCSAKSKLTPESPRGYHTYEWVVTTPATCETNGTQTQICSYCGDNNGNTRVINANGTHNISDWQTTKEPNCATGTPGEEIRYCYDCREVLETRSIEATHTVKIGTRTEITPATCKTTGEATYICKVCKKTVTEVLAKIPHVFEDNEGKVTTPATCTKQGVRQMQCVNCGKVEYVIEALGHSYAKDKNGNDKWEPRYVEDGYYMVRVCTREGCGAVDVGIRLPD